MNRMSDSKISYFWKYCMQNKNICEQNLFLLLIAYFKNSKLKL